MKHGASLALVAIGGALVGAVGYAFWAKSTSLTAAKTPAQIGLGDVAAKGIVDAVASDAATAALALV